MLLPRQTQMRPPGGSVAAVQLARQCSWSGWELHAICSCLALPCCLAAEGRPGLPCCFGWVAEHAGYEQC